MKQFLPRVKDQSPWGQIQHIERHGESGITSVSTAGHGGIYVPFELLQKIPKEWREDAARWSSSEQWYEEDCCWAYVAASLPEHFTDEDKFGAVSSLLCDKEHAAFLNEKFPELVAWYHEYIKCNGHKLRLGGGGSADGGLWRQYARSIDGTVEYSWLENHRIATVEARSKIPRFFLLDEYVHLMEPNSLTRKERQAA